jgi:DNA-directed RNA polymerase sigma subunit (sigma70/sigma32)
MPDDKQRFRIDVGTWSLDRKGGRASIKLESTSDVVQQANGNHVDEPNDRVAMFRRLLASGEVKNRAELARKYGLSRARISQLLGPGK